MSDSEARLADFDRLLRELAQNYPLSPERVVRLLVADEEGRLRVVGVRRGRRVGQAIEPDG